MSKAMQKIITYLAILVALQIVGLAVYQYGLTYGFNDKINPTTIIAGLMAVIGLLGLAGRYLNKKDSKRGYCESGISEEQIDMYRKKHAESASKNKIQERNHEDDNDQSC